MITLEVLVALPKMITKATPCFDVKQTDSGRQCPHEVSARDHKEVDTIIQRLQHLVRAELLVEENQTEELLPTSGKVMTDRAMRMFVEVFKGVGGKEGKEGGASTVVVEGPRKQAVSYYVIIGFSSLNGALGWVELGEREKVIDRIIRYLQSVIFLKRVWCR